MQDTRVRFDNRTPFTVELRRRVDAYFADTGKARHGGARLLVKTGLIFAWLIAGYVALMLIGTWPAAVVFGISSGLAMAGLGMAVQHDGGHRAFSNRRWLNRASASVLDLLGASSYVWHTKHGVIHHTYTNIEGTDDDIEAGPFARLSPTQPHRPMHRFQQFYMWPLYGFLTVKWLVFDDFANLAQGRVGTHTIARPRGADLAIFVLGKLVHVTWAIVIPVIVLGWFNALVFYVGMSAACGVTLAVVFQLAHCVEEAEFVDPRSPTQPAVLDFSAHQLATTIDFAHGNRLLGWYVGGLNFQAVHHLFPRVSHVHYPALSRIVAATAEEFGVEYTATPTLGAALRSHYRWLRRMGAGERHAVTAAPSVPPSVPPLAQAA